MEIKVKTTKKKTAVKKPAAKETKDRYFEAVGGRKRAVARVRIWPKKKNSIVVNEKPLEQYFPTREMKKTIQEPLERVGDKTSFAISVKVRGGGLNAQSEAIRHGIARALVAYDSELRTLLKKVGFLKRDPRRRERKKFGLKRARRARQWRKR